MFWSFRKAKAGPIKGIKDVFIQEVMMLNGGEFEAESIDIDSIGFAGK